jgi:gluconolactonase
VATTSVFTRLPDRLRISDRETDWSRSRGSGPLHSFLEGPAFDRAGNLFCVDICHGRIFQVSEDGEWDVFAEYDGNPNGLKIHQDGRIFVADQTQGLLSFDPVNRRRTVVLDRRWIDRFGGLNDLVFADNGDLYFTDPGESALENPVGRVFRLRSGGELGLLLGGLPYPNGLVLNARQDVLYVAVTRSLQVLRLPLQSDYRGVFKCGVFLQLSGGLAGPDGMAIDDEGNLLVAHSGLGTVWVFSEIGEPITRLRSCAGIRTIGGLLAMATATIPAGLVTNNDLAITFISIAVFFGSMSQPAQWALVSIVAPPAQISTFSGVSNFGGAIGGSLSAMVTGYIAQRTGSFAPALILGGIVATGAAILYGVVVQQPTEAKALD